MDWTKERLKKMSLSPRVGKYEAIPADKKEMGFKRTNPELFFFDAYSVGDKKGQAFFVPTDESSKKVAEYILRAIANYDGD